MKKFMLVIVLLLFALSFTSGCSSGTATGAGIGAGVMGLLSGTVEGAEADIERRKVALIAAYDKGVEMGATESELADIEKKWQDTLKIEAGKDIGKTLLGFNYSNPQSGDITSLVLAGITLFGGSRLRTTLKKYKAEKMGIAKAFTGSDNPDGTVTAENVYVSIAEERRKLKLPIG